MAGEVSALMAEAEAKKEEETRKKQMEKLKKAILARGKSVDAIIAEKIKNNPSFFDKFLADVIEEDDDVKAKLTKPLGPPSILTRSEQEIADFRRGLYERAEGRRQVRAVSRDSHFTSSGIQPGTYHNVLHGDA